MIQNNLLYTVESKLFPKVLRRLDDSKHTCIFAIPDEFVYEKTREELKMVPLVGNIPGKELTKYKYTKHILVYHHPYYLIIPIFEFFVFKNGNVNEYLNTLEIKIDPKKSVRHKAPYFHVSFRTNRSTVQTYNVVAIKLVYNSTMGK